MAQEAKVDVLTHAPLDKPLDDAEIPSMISTSCIVVPTLIMMKGTAKDLAGKRPDLDYANAHATVGALYRAGTPILAGTDSNRAAGVPATVPHGVRQWMRYELLRLCLRSISAYPIEV